MCRLGCAGKRSERFKREIRETFVSRRRLRMVTVRTCGNPTGFFIDYRNPYVSPRRPGVSSEFSRRPYQVRFDENARNVFWPERVSVYEIAASVTARKRPVPYVSKISSFPARVSLSVGRNYVR